ncbi:hypothetical protein CW751_08010 [Brumimicrobium salinarum]|uniref:Methionyl-tRNA formyltransferase-like protein n=1 Tax=Brumimicrobium salinarum TaxID=2058658 RepID=A0A2I0R2C5_9FLAO|nr:hypothetical protein [Brumimicrobium salinarum]PKR80705.1 hypothetical protein CW751_08010 [Brumimicrobium salinarum]
MNIYLNELCCAFKDVDEKYYSTQAFSGNWRELEPEKRKKYFQHIERNFAYELYHQWKIIRTNSVLENGKDELTLNAEIGKNGIKHKFVSNTVYPDLVLHQGQMETEMHKQIIFVEIKTDPSIDKKKLKKDLCKLEMAVGESLNYQNAVFVSINSDYNKLINNIYNIINDFSEASCNKINLLTKRGNEVIFVSFESIKQQNSLTKES